MLIADKDTMYHIRFGLHSKIPKCCIRYFINGGDGEYGDNWSCVSSWGYLPCTACRLAGLKVRIHLCHRLKCKQFRNQLERYYG